MKVFGITGWKNSGKTTLVASLVEHLNGRGLRVSTIKHAHCDFDIDKRGSDSYLHRAAGAQQVLLASNRRWALMSELRDDAEPELPDLLAQMQAVDLVIVEGFKMGDQPKIQVVRPQNNTEVLPMDAQPIVAIASDETVDPATYNCTGPLLPLNDVPAIADFILAYCDIEVGQ
ncbi:molybdopterin-guanine dinucleotide biosynthesis protein B [Pseudohalioglobus sediminis]|uniref:Molybdopterin-guanine dinucleotide biosynthesis protein B n=1 Tax=Pseudohalioglobus sediminis TaxID=2606449 RepID=A0A5B0WXL2_9GAMM|nr:molybdopterin-guanine dinucleotide biosynthesis protein B [Pseudohalioglobus sediminis]KAA1191790.1 molybdopterin-guanine dinucleotide biosynthesis protein B [Pseudohalioglobus sediminis]